MIITTKTPKKKVIELGSTCDRSNHCCKFTTGFLVEDDLLNIAEFLNLTPKQVKENYLDKQRIFHREFLRPRTIKKDKPYGRCVFLKEEGCSIHPVKPLHCKVATCRPYGEELLQWFYVNYLVDKNDPESVRQYANYIKFKDPIPGADLHELLSKELLEKYLDYHDLRRENGKQTEHVD